MKRVFCYIALSLMATNMPAGAAVKGTADTGNVQVHRRGDCLTLGMDLILDNLNVGSNNQVIYRTVVVAQSDTATFAKPVVLNGRNQQMKILRNPSWATPGAVELRRYNGTQQSVAIADTIPWQPWMTNCSVMLAEDVCGCGDLKSQRLVPLAVLDFSPADAPAMCYITPMAEAQKNRDESGQAFLDFIVNKTDIQPNYRNNQVEIQKIVNTINLVKDDPFVTITNINIHGFASPEGPYDNNVRLANGRAAALKDYVKGLYDLPDNIFSSNATPEDWDNLAKLIDQSDMPEREALLEIIATVNDPDKRDNEMKRQFPKAYAMMLRDWYPGLRRSDYKVSYVVRPLTIDEAKEVLKSNPKNLSLDEMFLVAQTYQPGSPEFNNVFEVAAKVFPDDPTANLNAACIALGSDELDRAEALLAKAGETPEAVHARGILAMKRGDFDTARTLLLSAKAAGVAQAEGNLKILDRNEWLAREGAIK